MRKIKLYIATSIDGYIARSNGDISWLHDPEFITPGQDYGYGEFYQSLDTTLMGGETYRVIKGFDMPFPYPDKKNFVFSQSGELKDDQHVKIIREDIPGFIKKLRTKAGKDIWLVGGGKINSLFLHHNFIDELIITIIPIVLGEGIPLFAGDAVERKFRLEEVRQFDGKISQMVYQPAAAKK